MKNFVIILEGPMGAGKSTVAKKTHSKLNSTALISMDKVKRFVSDFDSNPNRHLKTTFDVVLSMTLTYVKSGYNVIVEKWILSEEDFKKLKKLIKNKANIRIYQIDAPLSLRLKRLAKRKTFKDKKKIPTLDKIMRNHNYYYKLKYTKADRIFDSENLSARQISNQILKDLDVCK